MDGVQCLVHVVANPGFVGYVALWLLRKDQESPLPHAELVLCPHGIAVRSDEATRRLRQRQRRSNALSSSRTLLRLRTRICYVSHCSGARLPRRRRILKA